MSLCSFLASYFFVCCLAMLVCFFYIIKIFPIFDITVIGNYIYSKVSARILADSDIRFKYCKPTNRTTYYEIQNGDEIAFEGPTYKNFLQTINDAEYPIIPLSDQEILDLEHHTKFSDLNSIQKTILANFKNVNGVYFTNIFNNLDKPCPSQNPVLHIKKFFGNFYYVATSDEIWLTRLIISDIVDIHLQPGEIISTLHANIENIPFTEPSISESHDNQKVVLNNNISTTLIRKNTYSLEPDFTVNKIFDSTTNHHESTIYSLFKPRNFIDGPICLIHPFYFPSTWDPILTIMILTKARSRF